MLSRQKRKEAGVHASDQAIAERKREPAICSICFQPYSGFGHNAEPINHGRCCSDCNDLVVIPARIHQLAGRVG